MAIERIRIGGVYWRESGFSHIQRYNFAREYVSGQVLDIACGVGYGSYVLSWRAKHVTGVDVSGEAIAEAAAQHQRPNILFHHGDLASLPANPAEFDAAVCLETIEHLSDPVAFLRLLHARLKPGGRLVISAPNTLQHQRAVPPQPNEYHLSEPTYEQFQGWLAGLFAVEEEWEQCRILAPGMDFIEPLVRSGAGIAQLAVIRLLARWEGAVRRLLGKPLPSAFVAAPERGGLIADTVMLPLLPGRRDTAHTFVLIGRKM